MTCYSNTSMHKSIHTTCTPAGNLDLHAKIIHSTHLETRLEIVPPLPLQNVVTSPPSLVITLHSVTAGTRRAQSLQPLCVVFLPLGRRVGGGLARAGGREREGPLAREFLPLTDWNCDHVNFLICGERGRKEGGREREGGREGEGQMC